MLGDAIDKLNALSAYKPHDVWKDSDNAGNQGTVSDPYAHLKEAHDKGEMVQHQSENGKWHNCIHSSGWAYNDDPDRYRIKPKTKTLYKFAYLDEKTKSWKNTDVYHQTVVSARADILWAIEFKRLDYTAIEVEA